MIWLFLTSAFAATLTIRLPNVSNNGGSLRCALFDTAEAFPSRSDLAIRFLEIKARAGVCTCVLEDLTPGTYAVSVAHDANRNGTLDRSRIGRPTEGWGTSNNVTHLLSGPRFDESTLRVDGATTIDVILHYP